MLADRIRMGANPEEFVPEYVLATDADFSGTSNGSFKYIGTDYYVEIPHVIKGVGVLRYTELFRGTAVKGVISTNTNILRMDGMFRDSLAISLDLSNLDTSSATNLSSMFRDSQATRLDLSNFNTSNVTNMASMFYGSQARSLDLSSFDTSIVNRTDYMFNGSKATILDLRSFDISHLTVSNTANMFSSSLATIGYAKTQADADVLNGSLNKPAELTFIVKPEE